MGHAGTHGPVAHPRCRAQPRPGRDLRRCQGDAPPGIPRGLRLRPIAFAACRETHTRSGDGHLRPGPARPVPGTGRARGKSEDHVTLQADSAPRSVGGSRRYSTDRMICAPQNQKKVTNREGGGGAAAPWRPGANAVRGAFSGFTGLPVEVAFAESRHGCPFWSFPKRTSRTQSRRRQTRRQGITPPGLDARTKSARARGHRR